MTNTRHHATPMRTRSRRSTADKILSAGLATATCVGIVGVLGVRVAESSNAAQQDAAQGSTTAAGTDAAVSSTGLTQQQLDAYAAQLQQQGQQLDQYRAQLVQVASQLKGSAKTTPAVNTTKKSPSATTKVTAPKPVAKAAPKPAPKPVAKAAPKPAKPQSSTKSS